MDVRKSICTYCGCGCRLAFVVNDEKVVKVQPDEADPASQGSPCIKGLTIHEVIHKGRITRPSMRSSKERDLQMVGWKEALEFIWERLSAFDPRDIFFVPSGKIPNEDNYVMQKFARVVAKTNNVDSCCTRLCHASTVKALAEMTGLGASQGTMDDVYALDLLLIVGTNPATNYPVLFHRIAKAKRASGLRVISIQTIYNETANYADTALTINPGTEVALFNAVTNILIQTDRYDPSAEEIEGFDRLKAAVSQYDLDYAASICGCSVPEIQSVVDLLAKCKRLGVMHGMGLTQHRSAMPNLYSLFNLMMLKGGLLVSNRGEVNVQGVGDMGCLPDSLPSGPMVTADELAETWGFEVPGFQGKTIIEAFLLSPVKAAVITNFNPAQSLPNLDEVHKNLSNMFLVAMGSHRSLTDEFADVVLPTPTMLERRGCVTTGERRVRPVTKVIEPLREARPEWLIFCELAAMAGRRRHFSYSSEEDITREIVSITPAYRRMDVRALYSGEDQWADKEMKFRRFNPVHFKGIGEYASPKLPFILVSVRSPHRFLTDEMTSQSETLGRFADGPFVYLSPQAASKLGIGEGDRVRVKSTVAHLDGFVKISKRLPERIVGMQFHFRGLLLNRLVPPEYDPESFTPNYKAVAVDVEPLR